PFRILVQVAAAPLEQDNELAHILQIQPHADTVQRHLADIGAHVQDAGLLHFEADTLLVRRRDPYLQFFLFFHSNSGSFPGDLSGGIPAARFFRSSRTEGRSLLSVPSISSSTSAPSWEGPLSILRAASSSARRALFSASSASC